MPTEHRVISFFEGEFLWALHQYIRQTNGEPLEGDIANVAFSEDGDVTATVHFEKALPSRPFGATEIASILILYCIRSGIPLPKKAAKSLRVRQKRIELIVEFASHAEGDASSR